MDSIVLRDRNGKEINYHGIDYLNVKTPDGETQGYAAYDPETLIPENLVSGVKVGDVEGALEVPQAVETTIDPDFSAGDMEVVPEDGQVFSKVGILKPANLLPENIAEGVEIAGVAGMLAASADIKVYNGTFEAPSGTATGARISVNFGFVPDIIIISAPLSLFTSLNTYERSFFNIACSTAFITKYGAQIKNSLYCMDSKGVYAINDSRGMDVDEGTLPIFSADETGFNVGQRLLWAGKAYKVMAIGGLT